MGPEKEPVGKDARWRMSANAGIWWVRKKTAMVHTIKAVTVGRTALAVGDRYHDPKCLLYLQKELTWCSSQSFKFQFLV